MTKHIVIESIWPCVDGGRSPIKRVVGDTIAVEADIFRDGREIIRAVLKWRKKWDEKYQESPMVPLINDRWRGEFTVTENTRTMYTLEAWTDPFASWREDFLKRMPQEPRLECEIKEGIRLIQTVLARAKAADKKFLNDVIKKLDGDGHRFEPICALLKDERLLGIMTRLGERADAVTSTPEMEVIVDRERALVGAWYEMFVHSQGTVPGKMGTFADAKKRLPDIRSMGFDVVYLAPIHPIGVTSRKGPNNALKAGPNDPGCPWAVGGKKGGHTAIHPALGTLEDFDDFVKAAKESGMEIALDFAVQCSPDHPWVKDHPDWFYKRPDGSIKCAENPPNKYEDIYPLNFDAADWRRIWVEMKEVLLFWIQHGVKIFRVDNPHNKPVYFWQWLIEEIQSEYPDVIFLAEAFTRPKIMKALSKAGFTQSYTYFTWRQSKYDFAEYMKELTQSGVQEYFRPNFFTNTHDVLSPILQQGGRPAFKTRLVLAAFLSPSYGIYSGYELCENQAVPGTEEYLNSEKYEIKIRDWNKPGHIKDYIKMVNRIRSENRALQQLNNLKFFHAENDQILLFGKKTADNSNIILVAVNLDPFHVQETSGFIPAGDIGARPGGSFEVVDLITGQRFTWTEKIFIKLDPQGEPAHILRVEKKF